MPAKQPPIPPRSDRPPRTVIPNGPKIFKLRKHKGWTLEDLAWETRSVVEENAKSGTRRSCYSRRCASRIKNNEAVGISLTTLVSIENSEPKFLFTMKIVAEALGVEMHTLIHPLDPFFDTEPPSDSR